MTSSRTPALTLVLARAKNGVIGNAGALPWRLPSDLKRFKAATMGKPVVMGRKTWASLPKAPLPGRANIVVTRDAAFMAQGAHVFSDLAVALEAARAIAAGSGVGEACVIGGAEIFQAALADANRILLTEIDLEPEGDVRFSLDESDWRETAREQVEKGAKDDAAFVVRTLERRSGN